MLASRTTSRSPSLAVLVALVAVGFGCGGSDDESPQATTFIVNERNAGLQHVWNPAANTLSPLHAITANDVDCNASEGSAAAWWVEHINDHFGTFVHGSATGTSLDVSVAYAYPKHVAVFDGSVLVMSRNDATIKRYNLAGQELQSVATGNGVGQGLATDGTTVYASFWDGASSFFVRYDSTLTAMGPSIPNPTGMTGNNVFDFAFDPATGRFFGLATTGESGTLTQTTTVIEFVMGGAVVASRTLAIAADGIGQNRCP